MSELDLKPTFESARGKFLDFLRWYKDNRRQRNEATTRLHLIDTLFFDCLDWVKLADCECEEPHGREYADYVFKCPIRTMIVEAKKEGKYFDIPSGKQRRTYSLSHLTSSLPNLKAAVEQVSAYCQSRGVAIAVVTNGHQIVAFIGSRDDGRPPLSGRAIVFESLDAIANDFITFWNTLSKDGITERHIYRYLLGDTIAPRPSKPSELLLDYPGIQRRNIMQADLQNLASLIIHDIPSADETQDTFAKECYCPSNALSQYSVIGRQFLESRYKAIFEHAPDAPALIPATTKKGISKLLTAESIYRRPILLIGDVGVGKTTFIKQFISVEAKHVFDNALTIYVDFGSKAAFDPNIPNFLLNDI